MVYNTRNDIKVLLFSPVKFQSLDTKSSSDTEWDVPSVVWGTDATGTLTVASPSSGSWKPADGPTAWTRMCVRACVRVSASVYATLTSNLGNVAGFHKTPPPWNISPRTPNKKREYVSFSKRVSFTSRRGENGRQRGSPQHESQRRRRVRERENRTGGRWASETV